MAQTDGTLQRVSLEGLPLAKLKKIASHPGLLSEAELVTEKQVDEVEDPERKQLLVAAYAMQSKQLIGNGSPVWRRINFDDRERRTHHYFDEGGFLAASIVLKAGYNLVRNGREVNVVEGYSHNVHVRQGDGSFQRIDSGLVTQEQAMQLAVDQVTPRIP